jgi:hypothetical protein
MCGRFWAAINCGVCSFTVLRTEIRVQANTWVYLSLNFKSAAIG